MVYSLVVHHGIPVLGFVHLCVARLYVPAAACANSARQRWSLSQFSSRLPACEMALIGARMPFRLWPTSPHRGKFVGIIGKRQNGARESYSKHALVSHTVM